MKKIHIMKDSWYINLMQGVNQFISKPGRNVIDIQYQASLSDRFREVHSVMVVYEDESTDQT